MSKLCECGCGQPTSIAKRNIHSRGQIKGQPVRFINRHHFKNRFGEKSPRWKGGRGKSCGYISVNQPGGGNVHEHVLIATAVLGRPLPAKAEVHHHNGKRGDNRNANLVICQDRSYHFLIHKRQRAYLATGNPNSLKCNYCKLWGLDLVSTSSYNYYHKDCASKYNRERRKAGRE